MWILLSLTKKIRRITDTCTLLPKPNPIPNPNPDPKLNLAPPLIQTLNLTSPLIQTLTLLSELQNRTHPRNMISEFDFYFFILNLMNVFDGGNHEKVPNYQHYTWSAAVVTIND